MAAAVDEDVAHHAVAALAGETLLAVGLLGRGLVPLHRQVVMGDLQLLVSRFGVQLERLAWCKGREWTRVYNGRQTIFS